MKRILDELSAADYAASQGIAKLAIGRPRARRYRSAYRCLDAARRRIRWLVHHGDFGSAEVHRLHDASDDLRLAMAACCRIRGVRSPRTAVLRTEHARATLAAIRTVVYDTLAPLGPRASHQTTA